jgi:2-polyprenyl-3-methyl-5-hydroxy-6-metoxy-1,4-benzoquinol methylase
MTAVPSPQIYGGEFDPHNRNNPRTIIAGWVSPGSRVLEVGPGNGVIGAHLRGAKGCYVAGVEFVPDAAAVAASRFDAMIVGSIEDPAILQRTAEHAPYDAIIFADVLEHLVDPWQVLRQMRPLLGAQGQVLLSVPNIAHWTARLNLLLGRFDYTNGYLMDRTHLRWFTWRSARAMAMSCGYTVRDEATVFKPHFARFWRTFNGFQIVLRLAPADG